MRENVAVSPAISPGGRAFKLAWGLAATGMGVLYTAILAPIAAVIAPFGGVRMIAFIGRLWGWLIIKTCGIKVDYVGLEKILPLDSFVMVANHQSFFDIFALIGTMPHEVRFVAKKELLKIPIFGFALKRSGHVVIDRQRGQSIRKALAVSEGRYCVCVFAEGHRFNDARVHPFNEGAAWLAIQSGMPCVPVAITGSSEFFPRGAKVVVPGGRMQIWIGDPIPTTGLSSKQRGEVTKKLEDSVRAMFSGAAMEPQERSPNL